MAYEYWPPSLAMLSTIYTCMHVSVNVSCSHTANTILRDYRLHKYILSHHLDFLRRVIIQIGGPPTAFRSQRATVGPHTMTLLCS